VEEIFGIGHGLRYGLVDPIEDEVVTFDFVEALGDIEPGTRLSFAVGGTPSGRSYLPVDPAGARVVAIDARGRPALLRNELGAGSTVLCPYPLEYLGARTPRVNRGRTWRMYSALATAAGVARPVRVGDPALLRRAIRSC